MQTLAEKSAIAVRHRKFCAHTYVRRLLENYSDGNSENQDDFVGACIQDGMVRASFGIYTNDAHINALIETVRGIAVGDFASANRVERVLLFAKRSLRLPNDRG